ncbi:MAG: PLP-dependent aspartate aminotransferase family protein [Pseudomonadota bacterium]|nr:PLP-dependent aspartate aminotransferase family protein [Pseudomonadota bacterium]
MHQPTGINTTAIHGGFAHGSVGQPVSPPIVAATSFHTHPDAVGFSATEMNDATPPFYTRWSNPTVTVLEDRLTALEKGAGAVAYATGMGAIAALLLARLSAGDHLIVSSVCYAGVAEFAKDTLPRFGIEVSAVDTTNTQAVAHAIRPGKTRLIHVETPANPTLSLSDIQALAALAHDAGAELSVDSTIATPIGTQPLSLGADFVVHSLTKYICGHGDALGGAVIVRDKARLAELRQGALVHQGAALSPFAAWLILRGLETLPLRMAAHEANARRVAGFLAEHPAVRNVYWPGLATHPQAELARRQMRNFSGLLSFRVKTDSAGLARRLAQQARLVSYAVSLGKTKSLVFFIPTEDILRTSFDLDAEGAQAYRAVAGEGVFRLSVGLEDVDDVVAELSAALDQ